MKKSVGLFVLALVLSFSFTNAFAMDKDGSSQLKDLQKEAQTLLAERQKHMDEITRIETRLNVISGVMKQLAPAPAVVETPKAAKAEVKKVEENKVEETKEVKKDEGWLQ